jgi:hypothetical protein
MMSTNEIFSRKSLFKFRIFNADKRWSLIVQRSLFFTNAIGLNDRSPEQFEIIKHKTSAEQCKRWEICSTDPHCGSNWQHDDQHRMAMCNLWILQIQQTVGLPSHLERYSPADLFCAFPPYSYISHRPTALTALESSHYPKFMAELGYHLKQFPDIHVSIYSAQQCSLQLVKSYSQKCTRRRTFNFKVRNIKNGQHLVMHRIVTYSK